jgi:hypothetical protein
MISGKEFERRIRRISQMRQLILQLRRAALEAYRRGEIPFKPRIDIRSDYEYWRRKAEEKRAEEKRAAQ